MGKLGKCLLCTRFYDGVLCVDIFTFILLFLFWLCSVVYGILVAGPPTGPPGNSLYYIFSSTPNSPLLSVGDIAILNMRK